MIGLDWMSGKEVRKVERGWKNPIRFKDYFGGISKISGFHEEREIFKHRINIGWYKKNHLNHCPQDSEQTSEGEK